MKKILIVGASGMLGSRLMRLYARNYLVSGIDRNPSKESKNTYELDVTEKNGVEKLLRDLSPDLIVDTHAITGMDYCEEHKEEVWRVNVEGARNLAESAKKIGSKFVFISTSDVFDGKKRKPYVETDKPNPINYYGTTKLAGEKEVLSALPDAIVARSASLFGVGARSSSFTTWLISQLKEGKSVSVVTDQDNNFTLTDNLADFIIKLYEKREEGIFHTAGRDIINRFDFASKLADEFGFDRALISPTTSAKLNFRAKRVLWAGLDISKAEKATGIKGLGVEQAIHSFRLALNTG